MATMFENFGLDVFTEEEESLRGLIGMVIKEGKAVASYYGTPYFFKSMGNAEFWVSIKKGADDALHVADIDTHCGNRCVWDVIHTGIDITPKTEATHRHVGMFNNDTGRCLLPIDIITADVLPSFMAGDKMKLQIIALPLDIAYYPDEEAYADAQQADSKGEKWLVANGSLLAVNFLYNHNPDRYEKDKEYESDRYVHFTATVKKLYVGTFGMGEEKHNTFIRCIADTRFGELEFDHALSQVPEELRCNIKEGAVISGTCVLAGDAAIYQYDRGIVKDFDHNLKLLRYSFTKGEPQRLRSVLADDVIYETDTSGKSYCGADSIIERFEYIHEHREREYFTHFATIVSVDDPSLVYPVGTRCIVLAAEREDDYESIAFLEVNDEGMITKIKISTDGRYHFAIDKPADLGSDLQENDT